MTTTWFTRLRKRPAAEATLLLLAWLSWVAVVQLSPIRLLVALILLALLWMSWRLLYDWRKAARPAKQAKYEQIRGRQATD